jgi:ammonium transporter, Amt family
MKKILLILTSTLLLAAGNAFAQTEPLADTLLAATQTVPNVPEIAGPEPDEEYLALVERYGVTFDFFTISTLWTLIAAGLVFLMHLGFATLESGLTQSKNAVNVLFKNVFIICMGIFTYALWGFNAMYPGEFNGFFAFGSPITSAAYGDTDFSYGGTALCMTGWADFIFQAMFAATAATIISGAVAERIKLSSFMILGTFMVLLVYPITGSWKWGGGWLEAKGFYDFAGSTLVHGFGGFAALAAVIVLGPRSAKYPGKGKIRPILGHSMPLATIGVFLLFLGWFGFNGGSVLSADPEAVSLVFVTTALAAAAGGLASIFTGWAVLKKPDLSMALNGILAGLVGITAGANQMGPWAAVTVGAISGLIVVFSILLFDRIRIDDPVGAISVHGVCGIWGTIAVGLFGVGRGVEYTLLWQIIGALSICAFAFAMAFIASLAIKAVMGIRVSAEEENLGLDLGEHGMEAYPNFQPIAER